MESLCLFWQSGAEQDLPANEVLVALTIGMKNQSLRQP